MKGVMDSMKPDARVSYPQAHAPVDESLARALVTLADAFAKGDADKLRSMLDTSAQTLLDGMLASGDWASETKRIEEVRVIKLGEEPGDSAESTGGAATFAIQIPGAAYTLGFRGTKTGSNWIFTGAASPAGTKPRASDWENTTPEPPPEAPAPEAPKEPKPTAPTTTTTGGG